MMRSVATVLALFLLLAVPAKAGAESINLGTVSLTLGMSKDGVINALSPSYKLENLGDDNAAFQSWLVKSKSGPPFEPVANVTFKDGKLSSVRKYWGPDDQQKAISLAGGLYGVIDGFIQEGKRDCTIGTSEKHDPGFESKAIFIHCGGKYVTINIYRSEQTGEGTSIDEVLEQK